MSEMFEVIELSGMKTVTTPSPVNHVYAIDVSGSMYKSLDLMRQHLKNIISVVATDGDTFTIIYFSGRGQCGIVFENLLVDDINTISKMHQAIDKFLKPIGLTGFAEPLQLALDVLPRLTNTCNNFVMLTDGYDNQSNKPTMLELCEKVGKAYDSTSFIEYGWYCDRTLVTSMAKISNGIHIFAEDYEHYEEVFDDVIKSVVNIPMINIPINKRAKHAIYIANGTIHIKETVDNAISVPEDVTKLYSIVPNDVLNNTLSDEHVYLILYYADVESNVKLIWNCLERLGDIALINMYSNAFTKQELSTFSDSVKSAALNVEARYVNGKDLNYAPKKDAFTVIQCLQLLEDDAAQLVTTSKLFEYSRTTKEVKQLDESVTVDSQPMFIENTDHAVTITGLVYNSSRPNVSLKSLVKGVVRLPANDFFDTGKLIPSQQWRTYTIVKDGILHMKSLPLYVSPELIIELDAHNVPYDVIDDSQAKIYINLKLSKLPVINRAMINDNRLSDFSDLLYDIEILKAEQKVLNALILEQSVANSKTAILLETYGEDATAYLSSIGIKDYGFNLVGGSTAYESTDVYTSVQLEYKLKSLSSLPAMAAVNKKLANGKKLTIGEYLIHNAMIKFENSNSLIEDKASVVTLLRERYSRVAMIIYTIILGKTWFTDSTDSPASTTINFGDGYTSVLSVDIVKKDIKI